MFKRWPVTLLLASATLTGFLQTTSGAAVPNADASAAQLDETPQLGGNPIDDEVSADGPGNWRHDQLAAAQSMVSNYGITIDEALTQLGYQEALNNVDTSKDRGFQRVYSLYGPEYAVRYVTRSPNLADAARNAVNAALGTVAALDYKVVKLGRGSLVSASRRVSKAAPETDHIDAWLDVESDSVVYYPNVQPSESLRERVAAAAAPAAVRWDITQGAARPFVGGGGTLFGDPRCTGGFVVKVNGSSNLGLAGAGHCPGYVRYSSPTTGPQLNVVQQALGGPSDLAWYDNASVTWSPSFYIGTSGNRAVLGRISYENMKVNDFVCKYGQADGFRCGNITRLDVQPSSYVPNATPTFVGTNVMGCEGDSGGPVFAGNIAMGILSGGLYDASCAPIFFTPQNRLGTQLNVQVLVQ